MPGEQRRAALRWVPGDGNLALLGSRGAGTTTALRSIVAAACNDRRPSERHVYVIDASGDERLDELAALAHCAGVVRPHERERLARMLRRLVGELDRRRAARTTSDPEVIVAIDGMPALRAALDAPRRRRRARRAAADRVRGRWRRHRLRHDRGPAGRGAVVDPRVVCRSMAVPPRRPVGGDGVRGLAAARAGGVARSCRRRLDPPRGTARRRRAGALGGRGRTGEHRGATAGRACHGGGRSAR